MVEYKEDPIIKDLFMNEKPYVTQHMSAKDRNEYQQFRKGKAEKKPGQTGPMIPPPPMGFQIMPPQGQQVPPFMMPPMNMGRPMNNYNYQQNQYNQQM